MFEKYYDVNCGECLFMYSLQRASEILEEEQHCENNEEISTPHQTPFSSK